jgi:hypothetical protein
VTDLPADDAVPPIPDEIVSLAAARADARRDRDFGRADELKARIEAAGWKVVDDGPRFTLTSARPSDRVEDARVVHGSPASVTSRLDGAGSRGATVVIAVEDVTAAVASTAAVVATSEADVVLVAADPRIDRTDLLDRLRSVTAIAPVELGGANDAAARIEVVWTTDAFGPGATLLAGLQRVDRDYAIVLGPGVEPEGDLLAPIAGALSDPSVAVVGVDGLASSDLHRFTPAGPDRPTVALGPALFAFRRSDVGRLEAIDQRLGGFAGVAAWSSLALREPDGDVGQRRVAVIDLPLRDRPAPDEVERRDRYRISARFGEDDDLRT